MYTLIAELSGEQVEHDVQWLLYHPLFQPVEALENARVHDYAIVAYSPLAGGRVRAVEEVVEIAEARDATPETVSLA